MTTLRFEDDDHAARRAEIVVDYYDDHPGIYNHAYEAWLEETILRLTRKKNCKYLQDRPIDEILDAVSMLPPGFRVPKFWKQK